MHLAPSVSHTDRLKKHAPCFPETPPFVSSGSKVTGVKDRTRSAACYSNLNSRKQPSSSSQSGNNADHLLQNIRKSTNHKKKETLANTVGPRPSVQPYK